MTFGTQTLSASNSQTEFIFDLDDEPGAITHCGFRYGTRTGTPPSYLISIQGVDASGNPDGTIKGGGTPASKIFTPPASTAWNSTWQWIALDNSYTPSRGEGLSLVISYSSGTIDASNNGSFTTGVSGMWSTSGKPYGITNVAGSRTRTSSLPVFGLKGASLVYGLPIAAASSVTYDTGSSPNEYGVKFTLTRDMGDMIAGIAASLRPAAAGKTGALSLYDGTTALQTITVDSDALRAAATTNSLCRLLFSDATLSTLTYGNTYRVALKANEASSSWALTTYDMADAASMAVFPYSNDMCLTTRAGGAWTDDTTKRPAIELLFAPFTEPGSGSGGAGPLVGGRLVA